MLLIEIPHPVALVSGANLGRDGRGAITLGNLDARRDWGWAPDYVDALVRAARHEGGGGDFVIATGHTHSVAEFAAAALARVGVTDWESHIETDPQFVRPVDAAELVGDASKARRELGWQTTIDFADLVGAMVDHDLALLTA